MPQVCYDAPLVLFARPAAQAAPPKKNPPSGDGLFGLQGFLQQITGQFGLAQDELLLLAVAFLLWKEGCGIDTLLSLGYVFLMGLS